MTTTSYTLTAEGSDIAARGSHEYRVWEVLPAKGGEPVGVPDLKVCLVCMRLVHMDQGAWATYPGGLTGIFSK